MAATRARRTDGQATVEWLGLVLLVTIASLAVLGLVAGAGSVTGVAQAIATRLICATDLSRACAAPGPLVAAYGPELAARVEQNAPTIEYEAGTGDLPVDFRSCRRGRCGERPGDGRVVASLTGEPPTAFVHVVDCSTGAARGAGRSRGYDCSGARAGRLYLQYWLYYRDSDTSPWSGLPGRPGFHEDDWEGYQVRIGPDGVDARATSHHGYDYRGGPLNWPSDVGLIPKAAWGEATGRLYVSGGSHAGHVADSRRPTRWTPASALRLIPIERLGEARRTRFAITPPWRKPVYRDPEDQGT